MKKSRIAGIAFIAALLLLTAGAPLSSAASKRGKPVPPKSAALLNIQGHRTGMTMGQVKGVLRARKIARYETGYPDLFVYSPAPGAETRINFSCGPGGYVVSKVELIATFDARDSVDAVQAYERRLAAKYGAPSATASTSASGRIDSCWGQCGTAAIGVRLTAETSGAGEEKQRLTLVLEDDAVTQACAGLRRGKINSWLYQWITFAVKFKPGMTLNAASNAYAARFKERFFVDEVPLAGEGEVYAAGYELSDHEYFDSLDGNSRFFEGEGPGRMVLKFTGSQTGKAALDSRLYFSSFSTTNFRNAEYRDFDKKLERFARVFGKPADVVRQGESLYARWQQGEVTRILEIHSSGLVTFEQSKLSLRDAYRDQVVKNVELYRKSGFEKLPF
jgi:hypothetical protein